MKRFAPLAVVLSGLAGAIAGCWSGPPIHTVENEQRRAKPEPVLDPMRDERDFDEGVPVRIGLHWMPGTYEISSQTGALVAWDRTNEIAAAEERYTVEPSGPASVRVIDERGRVLTPATPSVRVQSRGGGHLLAGEMSVRGDLEITASGDSLFVVNLLPLEDYLRGVVPREIGPRPIEEIQAVSAQAVAARTYTVKRLGQYTGLPFDLFGSVQDQAYDGVAGENAIADAAIRQTRGLVLANGKGLIEAFYSSTCAGRRSDITAVWPHREVYDCLRGGPDGSRGSEWCRGSPHFTWVEEWNGVRLSQLVRAEVPLVLEIAPGSVRGDLVNLEVTRRGPSGRIAEILYTTTDGRWKVPGDRNRWVLRRPDGGILRSVLVELDVKRRDGRVVAVSAQGRGNGHGVGMCQVGAITRAQEGQDFRKILFSYYPGTRLRPMSGRDLPPGGFGAS